jgi:hypothetical protein
MSNLPERIRDGLTWRRIRNAMGDPFVLWRNFRFLWNDAVSDERHIFILGPPRSGTTLIKNVLRTHSRICSIDDESHFFLRKRYAAYRHDSIDDDVMEELIRHSRSVVDLFDRIARHVKEREGAPIFLEKTPSHALRLEYILNHFPESFVVFCVRDPRDGFRSSRNNPVFFRSLQTVSDSPQRVYTTHWTRSVGRYLEHFSRSNIYLLRYEDFCHNPEDCLRQIVSSIGINIEKDQLRSSAYSKTSVSGQEGHRRLKKPITAATVGKWKEVLTDQEIAEIESIAGDHMRRLGYSLSDDSNS